MDGATESSVDVLALWSMTDQELMNHCDRWYVHDRDPLWVRRNLMVIIGNIGNPGSREVVGMVNEGVIHRHPVIRAHAVWAAARLGLSHLLPTDDTDPMVADELEHLPALRGWP